MEGFSKPGSLGGEAFKDDEVEEHSMNDKTEDTTKLDDDAEVHGRKGARLTDDDDAEGHGRARLAVDDRAKATDDDDTEGHLKKVR